MMAFSQTKRRRVIVAMMVALMAVWPALAATPAAAMAAMGSGAGMVMAGAAGPQDCSGCPVQETGQEACAAACLGAISWAIMLDPATRVLARDGAPVPLKSATLAGAPTAPEPAPPRGLLAR